MTLLIVTPLGSFLVTFVSYAQNFEDVLLWRALRHVPNGFYVDVGAAHPDIDSVTRAFYDRGWTGINIEPTAEYSRRLAAARQRDINLQLALGERAGRAELFVAEGTGLSTVEEANVASIRSIGRDVHAVEIAVDTLANICRLHAPETIHFLKIDVEGAERSVLLGGNFKLFRPWIVVVEATAPMSTAETHAEWEYILLEAAYHPVWYDGLNRFYVAAEMHEQLRDAFRSPPNVFDDFVRVADTHWAARIEALEARAAILQERLLPAEHRATDLHERAVAAEVRAAYEALAATHARLHAEDLAREVAQRDARLEAAVIRASGAETHAEAEHRRAEYEAQRAAIYAQKQREAVAAFETLLGSTSWRVTAPLRRLRGGGEPSAPTVLEVPAAPRPEHGPPPQSLPEVETTPKEARNATPPPKVAHEIRAVHQFHPGSAMGDAITNAMLLMQKRLRALGYRSEIFVCFRDPDLADTLRLIDELPRHGDYVLIVRHSMGFDALQQIVALPAPKILFYHNITPPEFLQEEPLQHYAKLGRRQLRELRDIVTGSLADSEYNALELRALGFKNVQACSALFDIDALWAQAQAQPRRSDPHRLTILFVGRVIHSKAQAELVDTFAAFRTRYGKPCRLILVGRHGGETDAYLASIQRRIEVYGIEEDVVLAGLVSDEELHAWYAAADLYLSLSHHEGFAVPLVEAMAYDVPVLARPAAAVPYTLSGTGGLFDDDTRDGIVDRLMRFVADPEQRRLLIAQQRAALDRYRWTHHENTLLQALARAGAAPPISGETRRALTDAIRITITGHFSGSYSLASVNRGLVLDLETRYPGTVRVEPVESGTPTKTISGMTDTELTQITRMIERPRRTTSPEVLISQHYPVHVAEDHYDVAFAYVFWEESLLPPETVETLNRHFHGILAPTRFVAKTLTDSGVALPVFVVGFAPRLEAFQALATPREHRATDRFHFLHVSSGLRRKGIDLLLTAYARAFRRHDPVILTVKVYPNPMNTVAEDLAALQRADPEMPEVRLINDDIDEPAVVALYREADAIVLPTRGEGFNLPAAEAMASGRQLIVTGYTGQMDFTNDSVRHLAYRFARSGSHLASAGSLWLEPDGDDLVAALREAMARPPRATLPLRVPDGPVVAERILKAAVDLLIAPPPPPPSIGWISTWDVRCGIAEYSRHLVEGVVATGIAGPVIVLNDHRPSAGRGSIPGVAVRSCWNLGSMDDAELVRTVAEIDPDILVIQHQPGLVPWAGLANLVQTGCLRARPVIVVLHTTRRLLESGEHERATVLTALARVARVVVHTVDDLNRLKDLGLVENVTMMFQGAPPLRPGLTPLEEPETGSSFVIGCYGFFLPGKGIPQLVEAIGLLRAQSRSLRLSLVNADYGTVESETEMNRAREAAEKAGITDAIDWHTGFLPDAESIAHLRHCHLIVLPYQESKEGSSAALRMALSAGRPVAVTPLPFFDEADNAVRRFSGTDSRSIADGIATLIDAPADRDAIGAAAVGWLADREWPTIALRFAGMLRSLQSNFQDPSTTEMGSQHQAGLHAPTVG